MSVSREWLYEEVWAEPKRKVEAHYCVSSSFLARVCQRMNVPCPPRGSWARKTAGMTSKAPPLPASEPGDELAWVNGRGGYVPRQPYPSPSTRITRRTKGNCVHSRYRKCSGFGKRGEGSSNALSGTDLRLNPPPHRTYQPIPNIWPQQ